MRKSLWSPDEDEKLKHYVAKHGCGNWSDVAKHTGLKRCGKSCRLRWINYLRPDLKRGPFTPDEIRLIVNLHRDLGNSWSRIATYLPGRTDNDVKNFWHSYTRSKRMQTLPPAGISITEASKNQPAKPIATQQKVPDKSSSASEPPVYTNYTKFPANSTAPLDTALQSSRSLADSIIDQKSPTKLSADHYSGLVLLNDVQVCPTDISADRQLREVEEGIDCGHIDYDPQYHDHGHVLISQVSNYPVPSTALMSIDHLHEYNGSCVNDGISLPSLCFAVHEQYCAESEEYSINPPEDLQSVLWSFMHKPNYRQALNVLPSPCSYSSSSLASHSSASSGNSCSSDRKPIANYLKNNSGDNHDLIASNHAVLHTAPYAMLVDFR